VDIIVSSVTERLVRDIFRTSLQHFSWKLEEKFASLTFNSVPSLGYMPTQIDSSDNIKRIEKILQAGLGRLSRVESWAAPLLSPIFI
jgi:hypothetical protein